MPLTLKVGLSKKVGQPDYGSLGASCNVELELDSALLFNDLDGFHDKVRQAFVACNQAVQDELYRQQKPTTNLAQPAPAHSNGQAAHGNGHAATNGRQPRRERARPATASQVRAIETIALRQKLNLTEILWNDFGYSQPGELSITEASRLIDELKASVNGQANGHTNGHAGGGDR